LKRYVVMLAVMAVMALLMVALAVPAFAAPQLPLPGQTERGPDDARSICSYSGLNDFEEGPGPLTQSYGQEVKGPDATKPSEDFRQFDTPGFLCNPEKGPFEGPFEEGVEE
jgi:hypothetical protein